MRSAILACLLAACACAAPEGGDVARAAPRGQFPLSIPIDVKRPEGAGPFPAVVMLHDCSGLGPHSSGSPRRWAQLLVEAGYVVLIPDSFSTRGFPAGVCTDPSPERAEVSPRHRVRDAYEALRYARSLPYVDARHVGVMGGSHGGSTTLATIVAPQESYVSAENPGFAAAVALYPGCGPRYGDWSEKTGGTYRPLAPLTILIGENDDWTPAAPCERMAWGAQGAGYPVTIKVYPGARHGFDSGHAVRYDPRRVNSSAPGGRGATTGGDPAAAADAIREVKAFFARHLHDPAR
jgi:dienelactone hydrolase